MSTPRMCSNPLVIKDIINRGYIDQDPFILFDIGAGGGIAEYWNVFNQSFHAYGFDPQKKEISRLSDSTINPNIKYFEAFVGLKTEQENLQKKTISDSYESIRNFPELYPRSSSTLGQRLANFSLTDGFSIHDPEIFLTERKISVDSFCASNNINNIDFIKIDTDGNDYNVILGAEDSLVKKNILGLFVECQFHPTPENPENIFSNIDKYLSRIGFSLFDLEIYRYTKSALPGNFQYDIFAQTDKGQTLWGDALFIRDYASKDFEKIWGAISFEKKIKLICIYELFGLFDSAAELLLTMNIDSKIKNLWLDLLTKEINPTANNYHDYITSFKKDPYSFFPNNEYQRNKLNILKQFKIKMKDIIFLFSKFK